MNIALIGYGKMGKAIEETATERGHRIVVTLSSRASDSEWLALKNADVCIEFTKPEAAPGNINRCLEMGLSTVCGTTGWYDALETVRQQCLRHKGSFFHASNFSIGVNLFWQTNKRLAQLMAAYPEYTASIREIHHVQKRDAPSGTAITTAQQILAANPTLKSWKLSADAPSHNELSIDAVREGDVKGTHTVTYESATDRIQLTHEAKTRAGFALGAVLAAEFLQGKTGFFGMDDLLNIL